MKPILLDVAERVSVRRLSDEEGQRLQRLVRRGEPKTTKSMIRYRRAMVVPASAGGNSVPVIARLVAADDDTVREVIHRFNELGMGALDPHWAGGRPRRIRVEEEQFLIETATTRPEKLGGAVHRLERAQAGRLPGRERRADCADRPGAGSSALGRPQDHLPADQDLEGVTRPRPGRQAGPDRAGAHRAPGSGRSPSTSSAHWPGCRLRVPAGRRRASRPGCAATTTRPPGCGEFHGCYCVSEDRLWGVVRHRKSAANTLAALRSIRAARPDQGPVHVILDNLSAHKDARIRRWAARHNVELCFTPTYASWANPIEVHFGPLRSFVLAGSDHRNHVVLTRALHAHLRWRNAHAHHPDLLAAQRRERARVRSERHRRWGQPKHWTSA